MYSSLDSDEKMWKILVTGIGTDTETVHHLFCITGIGIDFQVDFCQNKTLKTDNRYTGFDQAITKLNCIPQGGRPSEQLVNLSPFDPYICLVKPAKGQKYSKFQI